MIYVENPNVEQTVRFPRTMTPPEPGTDLDPEAYDLSLFIRNTTDLRRLEGPLSVGLDGTYYVTDIVFGDIPEGEWEYQLKTAGGTVLSSGIIRFGPAPLFKTDQYEKTAEYEQYIAD